MYKQQNTPSHKLNTAFIYLSLTIFWLGIGLLITHPVSASPPLVNSDQDNITDDVVCTLREAILTVNGTPPNANCTNGTSITFAPAVNDIFIDSGTPLPALTGDNITIDGGNTVTLHGTATADSALTITGTNNIIQGLIIVEFPGHGIVISGANATGNTIINNFIGLELGNNDPLLGNGGSGILIENGAQDNIIGGLTPAERNTISFNAIGVQISGIGGATIPADETRNNIIQGNFIGLSEDGIQARANNIGIQIDSSANTNTIGGTDPNASNYISSNTTYGVLITGNNTTDNTIQGNNIGMDTLNLPEPNQIGIGIENNASASLVTENLLRFNTLNGVLIRSGASDNTITSNTIRNNATGIVITDATSVQNLISQNTTLSNTALGIDLGDDDITPNDSGDPDTGPNQLQNFPLISYAVDNGINTALIGFMDGLPSSAPYTIETFQVTGTGDTHGEGDTYLSSFTVPRTTVESLLASLSTGLVGQTLTTTATDSNNNTSEFSNNVVVESLLADFSFLPATGEVSLLVNFTDTSTGNIGTWSWDFGDGSPLSTLQNPSHTYTVPGDYTITLTITHISGLANATISYPITVLPSSNPTPTNTLTPTITSTVPTSTTAPTETQIFVPTNTSTLAPVPTTTNTPLPTATNTPLPSPTNTPLPTATNTPLPTATNTPLPTATNTPLPTATNTPLPTATNTPLPTATNTPLPTATNTPLPSPTNTPLPTATNTPLPPDIDIDKEQTDDDEFTITVENQGEDAENVVIIEELKPEVVYLSSTPGNPLCREESGVITCTLGTILGGENASVNIQVQGNGANITSGQTTVIVDGQSTTFEEPYIVKVSQPPFAAPGADINYTIRVINPTNATISNIRVTDTMPSSIQIVTVEATSGAVQINGQNIDFSQASLEAGGRITITIQAKLGQDSSENEIINRACVTSSANETARCAQAGFIRALALPTTGESQRGNIIFTIGIGIVLTVLTLTFIRFQSSKLAD